MGELRWWVLQWGGALRYCGPTRREPGTGNGARGEGTPCWNVWTLTLTIRYASRAIRHTVLRTPMAASLWTTYDRLAYVLAARTAELSQPKQ
jgi:hypothetical protein